jgi:hypothetical protein
MDIRGGFLLEALGIPTANCKKAIIYLDTWVGPVVEVTYKDNPTEFKRFKITTAHANKVEESDSLHVQIKAISVEAVIEAIHKNGAIRQAIRDAL